jgi:hypothetical protein
MVSVGQLALRAGVSPLISEAHPIIAKYAQYTYNGAVESTFDPKKNIINLRKHGVSLAEGDGVLNDPLALTMEDDSARGEQRFVTIGMNTFGRVMVVVYTYEGDDTRVISVRRAEPKERRAYEKGV